MSNAYKSTQIKVVVGYILLTLLLIFAVSYIHKEMKKLTNSGNYETEVNIRRKATNQVILQLYQAEIIGQSLSAGQIQDFPQYKKAIKGVAESIYHLKTLLSDSLQISRLDTVSNLLIEKEQNMRNLLKAIQDSNADQLYKKNMEKVIEEQDSLLNQQRVQRKIIIHQNSYTVKKKTRGFFQRIADVFSGGKPDSTTVINTRQELLTDTLLQAYNPADTVVTILRNIQTKVSDSQSQIEQILQRRIHTLQYNGWELSNKVNLILNTFEQEEQQHTQLKLMQEKQIRRNSAITIASIAISAVILVILFLFLIGRDITRSNHYRIELEKAKRRAEDLLVAREKMMLTITHDIKAPVGSILGYIDLLSRLLVDERQRFYLNNMQSSASHLLNLVSSLLDFHRLDSHKMEINHLPFNPKQLFDTIYTSFKPLATKKQLVLKYESDEESNDSYLGDPFRIRQIAENLLSNALKFTKKGSITLHTELKNNRLYFSVTDTGSGISTEEQKKLFQEFTRLHNAQGEEGFGLGLAITQKLVNLLDGEIQLESEPGKGSCFKVFIPLPVAREKSVNDSVNKQSVFISGKRDFNLLLIDDDRIQLNLTADMLNRPGLKVICCEQPEELFKLLKSQPFDIILTDIQMPAMNGFDLLEAIRSLTTSQTKDIPVVALTARSDMKEKQFIDKGFAGCLHKPFTLNDIITKINQILSANIQIKTIKVADKVENGTLNIQALTAFSEDDPEAAHEIIRTFITETEKNRESLLLHLQSGEMKEIKALAHKMLPLFTMLGAEACKEPLRWLECSTLENVTHEVTGKVNFIAHEMKSIIQQAEEYL